MNFARIQQTQIPDLAPVYGGARGRTMSTRHQLYAWKALKEAGIKTIIDLRLTDHTDRLPALCEEYGMLYFHYPVDTSAEAMEHMVELFELDTHFESGIGVGIRGYQKPGPVTIFKVSGNLSRYFLAEGQLLHCEGKPDLCRTQQVIQLNNPEQARYFLTDPIGNHHVIVPSHIGEIMTELLNTLE